METIETMRDWKRSLKTQPKIVITSYKRKNGKKITID